jgi:hypothetical protein
MATETAISVHHLRSTACSSYSPSGPTDAKHYRNGHSAFKARPGPAPSGGWSVGRGDGQLDCRWRAKKGTISSHSFAAGSGR